MQIISLLSDWQNESVYSAWAKAALLSRANDLQIIELCNQVKNFELAPGAYLLNISFSKFPKGSIHINYINSDQKDKQILIALANEQYIISSNNGFISMLDNIENVWVCNTKESPFNYINLAAEFAQKLSAGNHPDDFAKATKDYINLNEKYDMPSLAGNMLTGHVMHVDGFGNLHTNISKAYFDKNIGVRKFTLYLRKHDTHNTLQTHYNDRPETELVIFFNSSDYMEIALNKQNASGLLGMELGMKVIIEF
ncbi:MAG: SAM-dependent chlorinase/fluorinase [Bacteroidota bacterium]|nr:SAM-dependent chlorinase/fluorinase [Bacteroidota bacterium]